MTNPQSFCAELQVKSIADNFLSPSFNLGQLCKLDEIGELKVIALLNVLITDAVLFFQVGKIMDKHQVIETSHLILDDYKHFKPEDFKLCFTRAKKGHYGVLYDRIDGQVIMSWLISYDNERDGEVEAIRARQNREFKKEELRPLIPTPSSEKDEIFNKNITKLREALQKNKAARDEQKAVDVRPVNPAVVMHQRWIKQFDDLFLKQRSSKQQTVSRLVKKYGKMKNPFYGKKDNRTLIARVLDINGYLEHKQWQYELANMPANERLNEYLIKYPY